jgi:hypothetical protein
MPDDEFVDPDENAQLRAYAREIYLCFYGENDEDQKIGNGIINDADNIEKMKRVFKFEDVRTKFSNFLLTTALEIKVPVVDL